MQAVETRIRSPDSIANAVIDAAPDHLPKPPARPPAEPIIIKVPPRPHEEPEVDRPDDGETDDGIRRAPWMPDMPPPLPPEERPRQMPTDHPRPEASSSLTRRLGLASGEHEAYIGWAG